MSSKKLSGLEKKIWGDNAKWAQLHRASRGEPSAQLSDDVLDMRADKSGVSSVGRSERLAREEVEQGERDRLQVIQDEANAKQAAIDAQNASDEEARKRLREAQGGGYAANVLAGRSRSGQGGRNFGYGGGVRRLLSGS